MRTRRRESGFTRVEFLLTLLCIAALAAIAIPVTRRELAFAHGAVAHAQLDHLSRAIQSMLQDVRMRPTDGGYGSFVGPGEPPQQCRPRNPREFDQLWHRKPPVDLVAHIQGKWKGPYFAPIEPDPWGHALVVTSFGDPQKYIWCVSAGANGVLETTENDRWVRGDDIAVRIY